MEHQLTHEVRGDRWRAAGQAGHLDNCRAQDPAARNFAEQCFDGQVKVVFREERLGSISQTGSSVDLVFFVNESNERLRQIDDVRVVAEKIRRANEPRNDRPRGMIGWKSRRISCDRPLMRG